MYYNIELGDTDNKYVEIYAEPNSYNVGEVMVISQKGLQMSTSEVIGQSAIEYVQPNTIGDVMQLLPVITSYSIHYTKLYDTYTYTYSG